MSSLSGLIAFFEPMAAVAASSCIDQATTRLSSLSLDDSAPEVIVEGNGTIGSDDMPFVNRHEELWQVFRVNAKNMHQIMLSPDRPVEDFRPLQLLFCVQVSFMWLARLCLICSVLPRLTYVCPHLHSHHSTLALVRRRWVACFQSRSKTTSK